MIDKNHEGLWRPLHKFPLGWARLAAGSVFRLLFMLASHVFVALLIIWDVRSSESNIYPTIWLFFLIAYFPALYLYAIYRLLQIIEGLEQSVIKNVTGTIERDS